MTSVQERVERIRRDEQELDRRIVEAVVLRGSAYLPEVYAALPESDRRRISMRSVSDRLRKLEAAGLLRSELRGPVDNRGWPRRYYRPAAEVVIAAKVLVT